MVVFTMACRGKYLATLRRGMVQSRWAREFKSIVLKIERINWNLTGGCGKSNVGDYPATIMVNGINYYSTDNAVPVEVDESVIQYTTSYAEDGVPRKDGEANFNRDLGTPYAVIEEDLVVVLMDNEWIEFKAK